jgi:hypothetical protein
MTGLTEDVLATVLGGGVIAGQHHRRVARHQFQQCRRQDAAQQEHRPACVREDAVVAAEVPLINRAHYPQKTADGPPPHG